MCRPQLRAGGAEEDVTMVSLLSFMTDSPVALCAGLSTMYRDELSGAPTSDWQRSSHRLRKQLAWYRRKEAKARSGEYLWRMETERWVKNEIKRGTTAGTYLGERRDRVVAALGLTLEQARERLTFESERGDK
jgi:hypothetical protein